MSDLWKEPVSVIHDKGRSIAKDLRKRGEPFKAFILAPRIVDAAEKVSLSSSYLKLDERVGR